MDTHIVASCILLRDLIALSNLKAGGCLLASHWESYWRSVPKSPSLCAFVYASPPKFRWYAPLNVAKEVHNISTALLAPGLDFTPRAAIRAGRA